MTVSTKFELELRCNVCDSVLCINTESHCDKGGTWVYVEPCEKCSQPTPRALDDAEVCDCGEPFPESGSCRFCGARSRHRQ